MIPGPSSPSVYHFSTISIYLNMSMGWLFSKVLGSSTFERQLVFLIKTILFGKRQMRRISPEVKSLGYKQTSTTAAAATFSFATLPHLPRFRLQIILF